jgi:hypothetical protein
VFRVASFLIVLANDFRSDTNLDRSEANMIETNQFETIESMSLSCMALDLPGCHSENGASERGSRRFPFSVSHRDLRGDTTVGNG